MRTIRSESVEAAQGYIKSGWGVSDLLIAHFSSRIGAILTYFLGWLRAYSYKLSRTNPTDSISLSRQIPLKSQKCTA